MLPRQPPQHLQLLLRSLWWRRLHWVVVVVSWSLVEWWMGRDIHIK